MERSQPFYLSSHLLTCIVFFLRHLCPVLSHHYDTGPLLSARRSPDYFICMGSLSPHNAIWGYQHPHVPMRKAGKQQGVVGRDSRDSWPLQSCLCRKLQFAVGESRCPVFPQTAWTPRDFWVLYVVHVFGGVHWGGAPAFVLPLCALISFAGSALSPTECCTVSWAVTCPAPPWPSLPSSLLCLQIGAAVSWFLLCVLNGQMF